MLAELHLLVEVVVVVAVVVVVFVEMFFPPLFLPSPLPFPFREGIPLKESFSFVPFLPFLPFPFPQKAVCLAGHCPMLHNLFPLISDGSRVLIFFLSCLNDRPCNRRLEYDPFAP